MLGGAEPTLLVDVDAMYYPFNFKFHVVNGGWSGQYVSGTIHIDGNHGTPIDGYKILTDNQDRLRGEYGDVFANFDNLNWVAPTPDAAPFESNLEWDDDVPF